MTSCVSPRCSSSQGNSSSLTWSRSYWNNRKLPPDASHPNTFVIHLPKMWQTIYNNNNVTGRWKLYSFKIVWRPLLDRRKTKLKKTFQFFNSPGTSFDNGRSDGGEFPLEMFPEVVVKLVGGHLIVKHEVDGRRDVREQGLLQGRRVRQCRVLGDLQQNNIRTSFIFAHCKFQNSNWRMEQTLLTGRSLRDSRNCARLKLKEGGGGGQF